MFWNNSRTWHLLTKRLLDTHSSINIKEIDFLKLLLWKYNKHIYNRQNNTWLISVFQNLMLNSKVPLTQYRICGPFWWWSRPAPSSVHKLGPRTASGSLMWSQLSLFICGITIKLQVRPSLNLLSAKLFKPVLLLPIWLQYCTDAELGEIFCLYCTQKFK